MRRTEGSHPRLCRVTIRSAALCRGEVGTRMTKRAGRVAFLGRLAQLVRAAGLQPAGRGFEPLSAHLERHDRTSISWATGDVEWTPNTMVSPATRQQTGMTSGRAPRTTDVTHLGLEPRDQDIRALGRFLGALMASRGETLVLLEVGTLVLSTAIGDLCLTGVSVRARTISTWLAPGLAHGGHG